jgi:hypothetical protein
MFRVLFAPIIRSITAAYSHRLCMVLCVIALEQVLVWDSFTVKHGQLQYSHRSCMVWCVIALEQVLVWDSFTVKLGQLPHSAMYSPGIQFIYFGVAHKR